MKLTNDQQNTIDNFNDFLATPEEKYMIIQGNSGSGKSTLIKPLVDIAYKHLEMNQIICKTKTGSIDAPLLAATTNPAVAVLKNLTSYDAATIHSILGLTIKNDYNTGEKHLVLKKDAELIRNRLLIIDEASMINEELFGFIDNRTKQCKIILIGDKYQLAPVNQTTTVMETLACRTSVMTEIMRNKGVIQQTGTRYRHTVETGIFHPIEPDNVNMHQLSGKEFQQEIDKAFGSNDYQPSNAKVIAWTNAKVQEYNTYIRKLRGVPETLQINEIVVTNKPLVHRKQSYKSIDSTAQITIISAEYVGDYGVFGRSIKLDNYVEGFQPTSSEAEKNVLKTLAKKKSWREYFAVKDSWLDLRLPYASTCHKSQGHTYDKVFIDLADMSKCRIASDVARLLYVSITRAKSQVYLYGQLPSKYCGSPRQENLEKIVKLGNLFFRKEK